MSPRSAVFAFGALVGCFSPDRDSTTASASGATTTSSSTGSDTGCPAGGPGCPCYPNQTCDVGLACVAEVSVCIPQDCLPGTEQCSCIDGACVGDLTCVDAICQRSAVTSESSAGGEATSGSTATEQETRASSGDESAYGTVLTEGETSNAESSSSGASSDGTQACPAGQEGCLCDVGSACATGLECTDGFCVGCGPAEAEPNDAEGDAQVLPTTDCSVVGEFEGAYSGADVDWFRTSGTSCATHPIIEADLEEAAGRICMLAACEGGMVGCGPWETLDDGGGVRACCGTVRAGFDSGTCSEPPTTLMIRVEGGEAGVCTPYRLTWVWGPR